MWSPCSTGAVRVTRDHATPHQVLLKDHRKWNCCMRGQRDDVERFHYWLSDWASLSNILTHTLSLAHTLSHTHARICVGTQHVWCLKHSHTAVRTIVFITHIKAHRWLYLYDLSQVFACSTLVSLSGKCTRAWITRRMDPLCRGDGTGPNANSWINPCWLSTVCC